MMMFVLGKTLSYSQETAKAQMQQSDKVIMDLLGTMSRSALFSEEFDEVQYNMEQATRDPHIIRILLADSLGRVVVSSEFKYVGNKMPSLVSPPDQFWHTRQLNGMGQLAILFSNESLKKATKTMTHMGAVIAVTGMIIILISSLTIGHFLTRKLCLLSERASQFANGDMKVKTGFEGRDEVAIVGQTFDQMVNKISASIHSLQEARDDLEKRVDERTRELSELNLKLKTLSETDPLTMIANRARFDKVLTEGWKRSNRNNDTISLLLIDVDFFKLFNDSYGHQAGDDCLIQVARTINGHTQRDPGDLAARYGGEEFAVILYSTDVKGALLVAEKVRKSIEDLKIEHKASSAAGIVTVSIGVSTINVEKDTGPEAVIKRADLALYEAKEKGRNQVVAKY